jgi:hypothetical protein
MCAFIVRHKTPGLNGGSIRHRPPDLQAAHVRRLAEIAIDQHWPPRLSGTPNPLIEIHT